MAAAPTIQAQVSVLLEAFTFNQLGLEQLARSEPVALDLARRAIRVESAAKQNASQPPRNGPDSGSEPGGGPAVRTGRLRGSITWRLGKDAISVYADIGTSVFYGPFVELGTSRMEARPFLRPALDAASE
jgi:HK97 gp10 family phage protein